MRLNSQLSTSVDDGCVLFLPETSRFLDLNRTAAALLEVGVNTGWSFRGMAGHLHRVSLIPPCEAQSIIEAFVSDLTEQGLWVAITD